MLQQTGTGMKTFESESALSRTGRMLEETVPVIKEIEEEILTLIQTGESLHRNYSLLTGITGIGFVNAVNTMIYTRNFEAFDHARQYACFVGVAPFPHQSGNSVKGRTKESRFGNRHLKADLTQGAKSAAYWEPELKLYCQRKIGQGKQLWFCYQCREIQTHTENVCHSTKRNAFCQTGNIFKKIENNSKKYLKYLDIS
jgi:transposase